MKHFFLILISLFVFTACTSSKNVDTDNTISETNKIKIESNDNYAFEDEFDSEFNQEQKEVFDPLSGYNRIMTSFNDFFYMNILSKISKGYSYILPQNARIGISNFFDNIMFPIRFTNNLLQLKFKNATEEIGRFLINTTFGLAGFMDPAKDELGWTAHEEDFGQTLGFYGVGEGFHVVLPFLGPSNLRDIVGLTADSYLSPTTSTGSNKINYKIPKNIYQTSGIVMFKTLNTVSLKEGQYESIRKDALDLYPFLRDIYTQKRNQQIKE